MRQQTRKIVLVKVFVQLLSRFGRFQQIVEFHLSFFSQKNYISLYIFENLEEKSMINNLEDKRK